MGVPANVVDMHVSTEHIVDVGGIGPAGAEPVKKVRTHIGPQRDVAGTVIPDTRINENRVVWRAHYERMDAEAELQILSTEMWYQPVPMTCEVVIGDINKEKARANGPDHFLDTTNLDVPNPDRLHSFFLALALHTSYLDNA
jgi:hypothetical protein